jgi:hypothetical protein
MESNTTTPSQPAFSWVEDPNRRGTFGIFSFCLSTITISIWSAVHLDIPDKRDSSTRRFLIRVAWMFVALLAPEFLLFLAINQSIDAHTLQTRAAEFFHSRPMAPRGIFARGFHYILRRAKPHDVSTQKHALDNCSNSLNIAGELYLCRAANSTAGASLRSHPCVLCGDGWFQN